MKMNEIYSEEIADGHFTVFAPTNSAFDSIPGTFQVEKSF